MGRTRFGGAAGVVGRAIDLNDEAVAVVGVLDESFAFPYDHEPAFTTHCRERSDELPHHDFGRLEIF